MVGQDLPPFCIGAGFPLWVVGLNMIGLKRHGFPLSLRRELIKIYRLTYQSGLSWAEAKNQILEKFERNVYVQLWIDFCDETKRGLAPLRSKKEARQKELRLAQI